MTTTAPTPVGAADLRRKGLSPGSLGLLASVVLGVSSVAPVYALTATLGPTVSEVGLQMPAIFLAGFLPMLLVAYGYRELNRVAPDCGTSFTWATKAFNPVVGFMAGWGALLATVIVLSNLAGVAVTFFYLMLGQVLGSQAVVEFGDRTWVHVLTCLVFVAIATAVAYKGTALTKRVQYVLVGFQLAVLLLFTVLAVVKAVSGDAPDTVVDPELAWLDITQVPSFSAFTTASTVNSSRTASWKPTKTYCTRLVSAVPL